MDFKKIPGKKLKKLILSVADPVEKENRFDVVKILVDIGVPVDYIQQIFQSRVVKYFQKYKDVLEKLLMLKAKDLAVKFIRRILKNDILIVDEFLEFKVIVDYLAEIVQKNPKYKIPSGKFQDVCRKIEADYRKLHVENYDLPIDKNFDNIKLENGLVLEVPRRNHELIDMGVLMRNCLVYTEFGRRIWKEKSIIVFVYRNGNPVYVLEIDPDFYEIVQFYGPCNSKPDKDDEKIVRRYVRILRIGLE